VGHGYRGALRYRIGGSLKLRTALPPVLTALALAVPGAAQAAALSADRACYAPEEPVTLTGAGFTPSGEVALSVEGRQLGTGTADPTGGFQVTLSAPSIDSAQRTDTFTATDQTNLALTASVGVKLTALDVVVKPAKSTPSKRRRIAARGFIGGKTLWAHIRRGKFRRNVEVGKLKGPCGTIVKKKRLFPADAATGLYQVQFDTKRRYSDRTAPQVDYLFTIFRTFRPASLSAAPAGERWTWAP
jgi:hypothetical protein